MFPAGAPPSPPGAQGPLPIGGHSGDPGVTPFGVNFAQLNQEVRHIYSFAVIETAKRVAESVLRDSGGMQRIVDSSASNIAPSYPTPYAVGPVHGDARVSSAQRLHDGMLALLTGTRRVLEDKAFVALARGIWDHIGAVAHMAIENLQNGAEDPVRTLSSLFVCFFTCVQLLEGKLLQLAKGPLGCSPSTERSILHQQWQSSARHRGTDCCALWRCPARSLRVLFVM